MLFTLRERSCVLILTLAISSAATGITMVCKRIEGSETVEVCFTCVY